MENFNNAGLLGVNGPVFGSKAKKDFLDLVKICKGLHETGNSANAPLRKEIADMVLSRTAKLQSHIVRSNVLHGIATSVQLFPEGNTGRTKNSRNITNAKLDDQEALYCTAIRIRAVEAAAATAASASVSRYRGLWVAAEHGALACGTIQFQLDSEAVLKDTPLSLFDTQGNSNVPEGLLVLDTPILIDGSRVIKAFTELDVATGLTANTAVQIELFGVRATR